MEVAVTALARWLDYDVSEQDLQVSRARIPAIPSSRVHDRGRPRGAVGLGRQTTEYISRTPDNEPRSV